MADPRKDGEQARLLNPDRFGLPSPVLLVHDLLAQKEHVQLRAFSNLSSEEQSVLSHAVVNVLDKATAAVTASYDSREPQRREMQAALRQAMVDEIAKGDAGLMMSTPTVQGQTEQDRKEPAIVGQINLLKEFYVDGLGLERLTTRAGLERTRTNLRNARKRILKPLLMGTFGYGMENDEDVKVLRAFVLKVFQDDPSLLRGSGILDSLPRRFATSLDVDPTAHRRGSVQSLADLMGVAESTMDTEDSYNWDDNRDDDDQWGEVADDIRSS